jgi:uncharacterized protein YjiK
MQIKKVVVYKQIELNLVQFLLALQIAVIVFGCNPSNKRNSQEAETKAIFYEYDFMNPNQKYELPAILEEVSGLSFYKENQLLCVQDESAAFVYDLNRQKIMDSHQFEDPGDYEGIELVGDEVYVVRSDGKLLNFKFGDNKTHKIDTDLPGKNDVEGLAYDPIYKRLWIAVKESSKKGEKNANKLIYSFDLSKKELYLEQELKAKKLEKIGLQGKDWKDFKPSGIAFHPQTGEIYLLSSAGKRLLILNRDGEILRNIALIPAIFRQPEGICFSPDGTLYIASEGDGTKGYILKFDPQIQ